MKLKYIGPRIYLAYHSAPSGEVYGFQRNIPLEIKPEDEEYFKAMGPSSDFEIVKGTAEKIKETVKGEGS